jgi:RND family efflux transporter MFP subunit
MKNKFVIKSLFFFLLALSTFACKENYVDQEAIESSTKNSIPSVRLANIAPTQAPIPIEASGMVGSKAEILLSFKIGGIIDQLLADETQWVRKGQLIASLRTTEIDAQVMKAQQAVQKAERDVVRIKKMYADSAATLENVEDLTTLLQVTKSDLEIAQFNQQYAKIIAPVSGRILKRFPENNELIQPGAPVFQIASNAGKGFILKIGVADKDVIRIKLGDKAEVNFDAFPNTLFSAHVSEIAASADPRTGVFPIELTISPQKDKNLKNGFIGKVKLLPSNQAAYYKIPMNALVEGYKNRANVFTIKGDIAKKISIQPHYIASDFFTIPTNQLEEGTQVITDGAAYLKDGTKVKVVP